MKKLMITTALSTLMIAAAAAQSTNPTSGSQQPSTATQKETTPPPAVSQQSSPLPRGDMKASNDAPHFVNAQKSDQWLATKFMGTDVIGSDNKKIGSVNDILFDKDGKIHAYVIRVGGVLGIGAKDVALAPVSFQVVAGDKSKNESDKLKLSMSEDQLKQTADFKPYNPPRSTTGSGSSNAPSPRPNPMPPVAK
jgi:hypothetical protein